MAPLILHNVPDEELYIGEDGVQRPYAMIYPQYAPLFLASASSQPYRSSLFNHVHMLTTVQTGWQPEQRSKPPRSSRDRSLWQVDAPIAVEDCNPRQTRRSHHTIRPQGLRRLLRAAELPARRDHRPIIRLPEAAPSVRCPGPVRRQPSRRHVPADRCEVHRSQHPQRPHRGHPPRLQGRRPAICRHQPLRAHCRAYL